jgi:fatty acid desaturase
MATLPAEHCLVETASWHFRLSDVPAGIRTEIRKLHKIRPSLNAVVLLFPLTWVIAIAIMQRWPLILLRVVGIVVIGLCIQAMAILMHEALHCNLFRRPTLDQSIGFLLAVPAFFSMAAYKVAHLNHHRYTRTEKDQDEISNLCRTHAQYVTLYYSWFFVGTLLYMFIVPWKALTIASYKQRTRILIEYSLMFSFYAIVIFSAISTRHLSWLFLYWLVPAQIATALSNVRGLAEHLGTPGKGDALDRTRTVTSNRVVSFLMLNLNYHLEHHLFPAVPWYNLPQVHRLLRPIYARRQPEIRSSYMAYAMKCLKKGPERIL